jgi:hypothetical protein
MSLRRVLPVSRGCSLLLGTLSEIGLTVYATCQQRMLAPPWHLIILSHLLGGLRCFTPDFVFAFLYYDYVWHIVNFVILYIKHTCTLDILCEKGENIGHPVHRRLFEIYDIELAYSHLILLHCERYSNYMYYKMENVALGLFFNGAFVFSVPFRGVYGTCIVFTGFPGIANNTCLSHAAFFFYYDRFTLWKIILSISFDFQFVITHYCITLSNVYIVKKLQYFILQSTEYAVWKRWRISVLEIHKYTFQKQFQK